MPLKGIRMTHQREVILEELRKLKTHPTADELYDIVKRRLPRISLATVYRNLELLADLGLIQRLEVAGRAKRYDGNPRNHYHVRCLRCGRVGDVKVGATFSPEEVVAEGFEIRGFRVEFEGICENCQKKKKDG